MNEPASGGEGAASNALSGEPNVLAFTERLEALGTCGREQSKKRPGIPLKRHGGRLIRFSFDRIERVGAYELLQVPREGGSGIEELDTHDLAPDRHYGASLRRQRAEGTNVSVELCGSVDIDVGHRKSLGLNAKVIDLHGDVRHTCD